MSLDKYHAKRNFATTPEPRGVVKKSGERLAFFIQKHHASHLHYDFRLELDGTLKSWAIPKGPSLEPKDKRLAVLVEDHPLDYGLFEGEIPAKQYGAGQVIVWDTGTWKPDGDPEEGLRKGNLKFQLDGVKLQGRWALVRMGRANQDGAKAKENWLLIKEKDDAARHGEQADITTLLPDSVLKQAGKQTNKQTNKQATKNGASQPSASAAANSPTAGRQTKPAATSKPAVKAATTSAAKSGKTKVEKEQRGVTLAGPTTAIAAAMPAMIKPQLATLADKAPPGDEWLCEVKFDGYRALCRIENGRATLFTRNGNDWTAKWQGIADVAAALPVDQAWLDGEVVAIDESGNISFQALQNNVRHRLPERLAYYVFDLPYLNGHDLREVKLVERRGLLQALLDNAGEKTHSGSSNIAAGAASAKTKPEKKAPPAKAAAHRHAKDENAVTTERQSAILFSEHIGGDVANIFHHACLHGMEGIIAKRADAPYSSSRNSDWLKVKCQQRQEFVIGGYTDPAGARKNFGALLLGVFDDHGALQFVGRVGTGFDADLLQLLHKDFARLASKRSPFANDPPRTGAPALHWLKPTLVAEVKFAQWTADGILRHASFVGLREDKPARSIRREQPTPIAELLEPPAPQDHGGSGQSRTSKTSKAHSAEHKRADGHEGSQLDDRPDGHQERAGNSAARVKANGQRGQSTVAGVTLTHASRVLYPDIGFTKLDLAHYYEDIADWVLPHLAGRPMTLVRCPNGDGAACFFQKHVNATTSTDIEHIAVPGKTSAGATYMTATTLPSVIGMVQMGVLELHTWGAHGGKLDRPDRIIFDLDPAPGLAWSKVVEAAMLVRALLDEIGLQSFVKTTGGKGLHVVAPIVPQHGWEEIKAFTRSIAEHLERQMPQRFTASMAKAKRGGKIFVDYLRNGAEATAVAAYSTRARAGAPVSVPIAWEELEDEVRADSFTVLNLRERLDGLKADPWAEYFTLKQRVGARMLKAFAP